MAYFKCPHCGSENIQKCSVIYNSGTASHQSTTTINGKVEAETSGVSGTNLAQQLAPPAKKEENWIASVVCGAIAIFFVGGLANHFVVSIIVIVLAVLVKGQMIVLLAEMDIILLWIIMIPLFILIIVIEICRINIIMFLM